MDFSFRTGTTERADQAIDAGRSARRLLFTWCPLGVLAMLIGGGQNGAGKILVWVGIGMFLWGAIRAAYLKSDADCPRTARALHYALRWQCSSWWCGFPTTLLEIFSRWRSAPGAVVRR